MTESLVVVMSAVSRAGQGSDVRKVNVMESYKHSNTSIYFFGRILPIHLSMISNLKQCVKYTSYTANYKTLLKIGIIVEKRKRKHMF